MLFALQWKAEVSVGDLATALGFIVATIGLFFAVKQLRQGALEQRANSLLELTERYFADNDVRKFYYRLDYNQFSLDLDKFAGSDEERWLDQLIYTFDVIGQVVRMGALTPSEAQIFAFQASRVLNNPEVKKYLDWLDGEYAREGRPTPAHADARYLVQTLRQGAGGRRV